MPTVEEIKAQFETLNTPPAWPSGQEFIDILDQSDVEIGAELVELALEVFAEPPESRRSVMTGRLEAEIERSLQISRPPMSAERVNEIAAFFWTIKNPGKPSSYSQIGAEIGYGSEPTESAFDQIQNEGLVRRENAPTPGEHAHHVVGYGALPGMITPS